VAKVLPAFIARLPGYVAQLKRGMDDGDWEGIRSLVHQLKGSGTSYGFAAITARCGAIEQAITNGDATAHVRGLIEYLEHIEGYDSGE
jgi:HPt (histidine-containing phosphotransfer) domain-containing protein